MKPLTANGMLNLKTTPLTGTVKMSSAICKNFVQNAWKKELCSNCFKSKDEHQTNNKPRPIKQILSTNTKPLSSIIKTTNNKTTVVNNKLAKKSKPKSVCFHKELTEIIGIGGEDWDDTDNDDNHDDDDDSSETTSEDDDAAIGSQSSMLDDESEQELKRITKENTNFNSTALKADYVVDASDAKKTPSSSSSSSYTQLLLGKPVVDAAGRKQTLLVSVTPFGEDSRPYQQHSAAPKKIFKPPTTTTVVTSSHLPTISKNVGDHKESSMLLTESNVVLTSYTKQHQHNDNSSISSSSNSNSVVKQEEKSLLDEITETLENSKNPIQIMSRKKIQKDIVLQGADNNNNKENQIKNDKKESLDVGLSSSKSKKDGGDASMTKKSPSSLSTSTSLMTAATAQQQQQQNTNQERKISLSRTPALKRDQEKPVIYQTSTAKIELLNSKNTKLSNNNNNNNNKNHLIKTATNNNSNSLGKIIIDESLSIKSNDSNNKKAIPSLSSSSSLSDSSSNNNNDINRKSLSNNINNRMVMNQNGDESIGHTNKSMVLGLPPPVPKPYQTSFQQSRELAGEPDGRADPDVINEPPAPALPLTPPPPIESQHSFLHASGGGGNEKPKVPSKPPPSINNNIMPIRNNNNNNKQQQIVDGKLLTTFACTNTTVAAAASAQNTNSNKLLLLQKHLHDDLNVDVGGGGVATNKRRAPKPPPSSIVDDDDGVVDVVGNGYNNNVRHSLLVATPPPPPPPTLVVGDSKKRERSSSCSPKLRNTNMISNHPQGSSNNSYEDDGDLSNKAVPEPIPRKSLSLSTDSLVSVGGDGDKDNKQQQQQQRKTKGRFSLKKFLRMGSSSKDMMISSSSKVDSIRIDENVELMSSSTLTMQQQQSPPPQPKPRLIIVHPSELNGAKVEVLTTTKNGVNSNVVSNATTSTLSTDDYELIAKGKTNKHNNNKPPPPPRNLNLVVGGGGGDDWVRHHHHHHQQQDLPHPPKSIEIQNKQRLFSSNTTSGPTTTNHKTMETVYANIGEVRSAIVPNKPQRTASMREREAQQQKRCSIISNNSNSNHNNNYELIDVINNNNNDNNGENVYDFIRNGGGRSSSSDSDSLHNHHHQHGMNNNNNNNDSSRRSKNNSPTIMMDGGGGGGGDIVSSCGKIVVGRLNKRSESSVDIGSHGDYFKYGNLPRSMSLTYCGSETESEIYSPYSFYGSESEVAEDDHDWIQNGRTHKLRSRKGRSIVHKNLEDNYGAVIVANHEALAQVLENIQQTIHIQPALRGLKSASNLRWHDFQIQSGGGGTTQSSSIVVGRRIFHQALWGAQHVTLMIAAGSGSSSTLSLGAFSLCTVTEFSDLIPCQYLPPSQSTINNNNNNNSTDKRVQATVAVLPWLQINTLQSYADLLKAKFVQTHEDTTKDAIFVMLQLVNALKTLQAQGIEELSLSLNSFVLCNEMERETHQRLCILQGLGEEMGNKNDGTTDRYGSLCMCAITALTQFHITSSSSKLTPLIQSLLNNERAVSLTQVKSVLEFSLWGPSDVALGSTIRERELALQRWLDLQRATVLHGLVCTRVQLTTYEQCHLMFLVRSNSRMMCDASLLLESSSINKHTSSIIR